MSRPTSNIRLTQFQKHVAIGTLLGDSSLSCPRSGKNFHLSCYHAAKQSEWLKQKHEWLSPASRPIQWCNYLDRRDGKTRPGGRFHTVSIPCLTEIAAMLYTPRGKVISREYLSHFTEPVSLACLIADDGSWDGAGIAIASKQFAISENLRLATHLSDAFGISCRANTAGRYPFVRITAESVAKLRDICFEWLPNSMRYKFGPPDYRTTLVGMVSKKCEGCNREFFSYESENRRACSHECGTKIRSTGYATRSKSRDCAVCGKSMIAYSKRHTRCSVCRTLRTENISCAVCGGPVEHNGRVTCSPRCGSIFGHRQRQ